jgi:signal transduction histidine kinase
VRVSAGAAEAVRIVVEDDGKGMSAEEVALALRPGARLDESGVGYGFGLGIVQELAELYGGTLTLRRSETLGGVAAAVTLPRQAG